MQFRKFGKTNLDISALGFGCMRLPVINGKDGEIDEAKATEMIQYAIDQGVNYLDTAYAYHDGKSEAIVGKILQKVDREKIYVATKLPTWLINTREDMDRYLDEQLERLQTDYIDFYLLHILTSKNWPIMKKLDVFSFLDSALADGRIRYAGFSFHDELPLFKEIVDSYDWTFCQIQYNYLDEKYQAGTAGLEYAAERDLAVIVMEPLRGGQLATQIPTDVQKIYDSAAEQKTPVERAFRFIWDRADVNLVLSGMSTMEQVEENIHIVENAHVGSMTVEEKNIVEKVKTLYQSKIKVPCTDCQYCLPCPEGVHIPKCFTYLNYGSMLDDNKAAKGAYSVFVHKDQRASLCVQCGQCVEKCPQNIEIPDRLEEVVQLFE